MADFHIESVVSFFFTVFTKSLYELNEAADAYNERDDEVNMRHLMKTFSLTFNCARAIIYAMLSEVISTREPAELIFEKAEEVGLIRDAAIWIDMLAQRENMLGTIRNEKTLAFAERVCTDFFDELAGFAHSLIID